MTGTRCSRGDYGVRFGFYNILACFNIGPIDRPGQVGIGASGIASEVTGSKLRAAD